MPPASAPVAKTQHPTQGRTTGRRSARIPQVVLDDLADGLEREQRYAASLNTPGGLAEYNQVAALNAYIHQLNEPLISVHAGVLYINGRPQPSTTVSLTGLIQALRAAPAVSNASAPAPTRGSKRGARQTKKST